MKMSTTSKKYPPLSSSAVLDEVSLLAMLEADYMNAAQLAFFQARLRAMRAELERNARMTAEHLHGAIALPDPNDHATVEEAQALELRVRDRERKLLKKIDEALARIEDGSYGFCEETGEPIGLPRLLARPTASLSIEAQELRERLQNVQAA